MTSMWNAPSWAEWILRALLPPDRADDVTGDLLETFRDQSRLSSRLARQAWWARQVASRFFRSYYLFPLALIATLIWNDLFNTFRDVNGTNVGPNLFGPMLFIVFLGAGTFGGWRTRRTIGGVIASVGSHLVGWSVITCWFALTTYPFALSQQHNPYWIQAWRGSAAPGESFMHWIAWDNVGAVLLGGSALLLLSFAAGLAGGVTGRWLGRHRAPSRA